MQNAPLLMRDPEKFIRNYTDGVGSSSLNHIYSDNAAKPHKADGLNSSRPVLVKKAMITPG